MRLVCTYFTFFILASLLSLAVSGQNTDFISVRIEPKLIESGEYKNYYKFDLGNYVLLNGRYENNLRYKLLNTNTNQIDYENKKSMSDAMIRIPRFFFNEDKSIIIMLMEEAAEYSWGQEVILISGGKINNLGYLSYAVLGEEYEESLADYCRIQGNKNKLVMSFEDVQILDYENNDAIIKGKDLKFEMSLEGIKRIH
jgi:hypothetical protein